MTVPRWPGHPRRGSPMSAPGPDPSQPSAVSGKQLALIVYILYFVSYFTGITALIGVIIAHVQLASADALLSTHCRFQIRTFWIGLLYLAIGIVLASVIVGIAVLFWWFIWSLVRNVKGVLALNEKQTDCESELVDVRMTRSRPIAAAVNVAAGSTVGVAVLDCSVVD